MRINTQNVQLDNIELENVKTFCYLGITISANGGFKADISKMKSNQAFGVQNAELLDRYAVYQNKNIQHQY